MVPRFVVVVLLAAVPSVAAAQQRRLPPVDSTAVELRLTDGSVLAGRVVSATDSSVTLRTPAGATVVVPARTLARWRRLRAAVLGGKLRPRDPNVSRLFIAPTARTLPRGEAYFGDYYLFFPSVGFGVADRVTVSGGMSLIPGVSLGDQAYYVAPKIGLAQSRSFGLAVGVLYAGAALASHGASGGVAFAVTTLGSEDRALTLGLGWPFVVGTGGAKDPWGMFGAEWRLSDHLKLLAEGWKFPGVGEVPCVFGVRMFSERIAVDFGLLNVLGADMGNWPFVPWVDFAVQL
jgi:hypothetical protein